MLLNDLHLTSTDSAELNSFAVKKEKEIKLLKQGTEKDKEEFWILKMTWLTKQDELGTELLHLENQRLKNANTEFKYLKIFGKVEVELQIQINRYNRLLISVQLKENNPDLDNEGMEQEVKKIEEQQETEFLELKFRTMLAEGYSDEFLQFGRPLDEKELADYKDECKRILRECYKILYPDRLKFHKGYDNLTETQKNYLKELWHELMKIKDDQLGKAPNDLHYHNISLADLQQILVEAKATLENAGLELNVNYLIQGKTIKEQINWLSNEIERLDKDIVKIKAEYAAEVENEDIKEKAAVLGNPAQHEKINADLMAKAKDYCNRADKLEKKLNDLFK